MRIAVLTDDVYLRRLIEITLGRLGEVTDYSRTVAADVLIVDTDCSLSYDFGGRVIALSREEREGAYLLPLPRGRLAELVQQEEAYAPRLFLRERERSAVLNGKEIRLTAQEYSLLSFLLSKRGGYATRTEISREVWGGASDGLINIYIHYLREKLESEGEKIIISSRSHGYRISEKYVE